MNVIVIDKSQPDMAEAFKDCKVGEPKTFTVTATPITDDDAHLVATVDSVEYTESSGEAAPESAPAEEMPMDMENTPYKPKARKGAAMAVES